MTDTSTTNTSTAAATTNTAATNHSSPEAPKWIYEEVLPAIGTRVRSLHLLKQTGARRSVLLFTEEAAMVAEKGRFGHVKVYRVDYPRGLMLNESNCPHCGKPIQEPVGKIARLASEKDAATQESSGPSDKQKDVLAYARDMKTLRARAKAAPGGKGPIKNRAAAQKLRKKHGLG